MKHALYFLWRLILVVYCVGVPIIIVMLYKENNENMTRIDGIKERLHNHFMIKDNHNKVHEGQQKNRAGKGRHNKQRQQNLDNMYDTNHLRNTKQRQYEDNFQTRTKFDDYSNTRSNDRYNNDIRMRRDANFNTAPEGQDDLPTDLVPSKSKDQISNENSEQTEHEMINEPNSQKTKDTHTSRTNENNDSLDSEKVKDSPKSRNYRYNTESNSAYREKDSNQQLPKQKSGSTHSNLWWDIPNDAPNERKRREADTIQHASKNIEEEIEKVNRTFREFQTKMTLLTSMERLLNRGNWLNATLKSIRKELISKACPCRKGKKKPNGECDCGDLERSSRSQIKIGPKGESGPAGSSGLNATCECKQAQYSITYIRWGSKFCPLDTQNELYSGYTSGDGSSNYMCLPDNPQYMKFDQKSKTHTATIDGVKYGTQNVIFSNLLKDKAVPCTLCHVTGFAMTTMFPATTKCPDKWKELYSGYIVTQPTNRNFKRKEYICLIGDGDNKPVHGSRRIKTGRLDPVYAKCDILDCTANKYREDAELPCVVCAR